MARWRYPLIVVGVGVAGIVAPSILLIVVSVMAIEFQLRSALSRDIFDSRFFRYVVATVLYSCLLQAVVMVGWLVAHDLPLHWTVSGAAFVVALAWLANRLYGDRQRSNSASDSAVPLIRRTDVIALVVAVFAVILVVVGPVVRSIHAFGEIDTTYVAVASVTGNVDDPAHLAMFHDHLKLDRGVLFRSDRQKFANNADNLAAYPRSLHAAAAAVTGAVASRNLTWHWTMAAYVIAKLLVLALAAFLLARAVGLCLGSGGLAGGGRLVVAGFVSMFFVHYMLLSSFKIGFFTFMGLQACLLLLGMLLVRPAKRQEEFVSVMGPVALVASGSVLCWPLVAPGLAVSLALLFLSPTASLPLRQQGLAFVRACLRVSPILVVVAVALATQAWLEFSSRDVGEQVVAKGALYRPSGGFYLLIFSGFVLLIWLSTRGRLTGVLVTGVGLLTSSTALFAFQMWHSGEVNYYGFKVLDAGVTLLVPFAIAGWVLAVAKFVHGRDALERVSLVVAAMVFLPLGVGFLPLGVGFEPKHSQLVSYIHGERLFSPVESLTMAALADPIRGTARRQDVMFFDSRAVDRTDVGTMFLRSARRVDSCDDRKRAATMGEPNINRLLEAISDCQEGRLTIVTTPEDYRPLQLQVARRRLSGVVAVVAPCRSAHAVHRSGCGR